VLLLGADIDALCVAPRHIERTEFFSSFYKQLQSEPGIQDLRVSILFILFRSTLPSWPNTVGLKCPLVRTSVRPSVHRKFPRFQWNLVCR